jgi:hypothetical protein
MSDSDPQTTPEPIDVEVRERTVGINLGLWFFPEFDQWELSFTRNSYGEPILAIGPFRARWSPVIIRRFANGR